MEIQRRAALSQALQGQAMAPVKSSAPIHAFEGLSKIAQAYASKQQGNKAQELAKALGQQQTDRRGADMSLLAGALQGRQAQPAGLSEDASGNVTPTDPIQAQSPVQGLGQAIPMMSPEMQPLALNTMIGAQTREDTQKFQADQAKQAQIARTQDRLLQIESAERQAGENRALREQMASEANALRAELARLSATTRTENRPPMAVVGPDGKPKYVRPDEAPGQQPWNPRPGGGQLPTAALKLQDEKLGEIGIAGSINSDLGALREQLEPQVGLKGQSVDPALQLGPVQNLYSQGRNMLGMSNQNSRNFASFKSTIEKLRNDSLRLNKGVQTEGDAQRAWNELFANINDPEVVGQRIDEIQRINQRAVDLKRLEIDSLRANFGLDPMDTQKFSAPPAAVGQGGQQQPQPAYGGPERRKGGLPPGVKVRRVQ